MRARGGEFRPCIPCLRQPSLVRSYFEAAVTPKNVRETSVCSARLLRNRAGPSTTTQDQVKIAKLMPLVASLERSPVAGLEELPTCHRLDHGQMRSPRLMPSR